MKRVLGPLFALATTVTALTGLASTATAEAAAATVDAKNVEFLTRYTCNSQTVTVSDLDGAQHEIKVVDPASGQVGDTTTVPAEASSGSVAIRLCAPTNPVGRYSVQVDNGEVGSFTVAKPAITTRIVDRGTPDAGIEGHLFIGAKNLARTPVAVEVYLDGAYQYAGMTSTGNYGRIGIECANQGYDSFCANRWFRFNYGKGWAVSGGFHLPYRTR